MEGRTATMRTVLLAPHPASPPSPVERVAVMVERDGDALSLRFVADGSVDEVAWPRLEPPGRSDDLWRHTCFEAFVQTSQGYVEFNLSPSGQWASYRFDAPRVGMRNADEVASPPSLDGAVDMVAIEARLELPPGATRLGLSAVIETVDGAFSHWALVHPSDKPDFHHPDSFILELP